VIESPIERLNKALEGRYRIEREIGEGGMAFVYLAWFETHQRQVALKVLKPHLAATLGADRFLAEIRTTAGLQHPHILPLFDSGEADGFLFFVMPFVEGETLRERIERDGQLAVDEAVSVATAVANALQAAHEKGIVHRDIKPANILLSGGEPLVADFGIAVAVGAASDTRVTETGLSIGTPFYMSPEQASGDQTVGPATDVFSLACVLYEMLVGEPPYTGNTAQAILGKILTEGPVSSTGVRSSIPINVDAAIRRGLERVPADRFTKATDFARALRNPSFRHGEWKLGSRRAGEQRWRRLAVASSVAAAAFAGLFLWSALQPEPPRPVERFTIDANAIGTPALLPDGSGMVYAAPGDQDESNLWLHRWENLTPVAVAGVTGQLGGTPTISPDGSQIAYHVDGTLKTVALLGGTPQSIAEGAECCSRWSADGYIYYSARGAQNLMRVAEAGGVPTEVTPPLGWGGRQGDFQVMPGGRVAIGTVWSNPPHLRAIDLETGENRTLAEGLRAYVADDGLTIFANMLGQLLATHFDAEEMEFSSVPVPVMEGVYVDNQNRPIYTVSESGSLAYSALGRWGARPVWVDRQGRITPIAEDLEYDPSGNGPLAISPDGSKLAMSIIDYPRTDIHVMDLTRPLTPRRRVTFDAETNDRPTWFPDSNTLAYLARELGDRSLWTINADGSQTTLLLDDDTHRLLGAEISSDGHWLIYRRGQEAQSLSDGSGFSDLYLRDLTGSEDDRPIVATEFDERSPALSPDGRWLLFTSDRSGSDEVYALPFPNTDGPLSQISEGGGGEPLWARDGSEIYYRNSNDEMVEVTVSGGSPLAVLERTVLFSTIDFQENTTGAIQSYQIHPDGTRFLMIQKGDLLGRVILVKNWLDEVRARLAN
jgi:Tol biopolymer transport system component